jgi:hypothetical protein
MCHCTQLKKSALPNFIYRFNAIPIKISLNYFMDINKLTAKAVQWNKDSFIQQEILEQLDIHMQKTNKIPSINRLYSFYKN